MEVGTGPVEVALSPRLAAARVTLVRPPVVVMPHSLAAHGPIPPIGLAYVASAVRQAGHHVQLIDAPGEALDQWVEFETPVGAVQRIGLSLEQIVDRIDPRSTVIGITNMFQHEWPQVRELAGLVRDRFPDAFVVLGGENATAFRSWILDEAPAVDCIVIGEGEATMLGLLDRLTAGAPLDGLDGVLLREGVDGRPVDSGLPVRLGKAQLDESARPAWDLVPLQNYWAHYPFLGVNRGRSMPILGTRGCPYKCSFCSSPQMWTTRYVMRDPEDVVDEIVEYVDRYGVENVNFVDLTAATNRKWILGLCDALERRAPGITWQLPIGTRAEAIDGEVLQRLWDTGCRNISLCPESGSERMLEIYDKRVKLPHILESVRNAREVGIWTVVHIIIGHPDETWSDVWKSTRFLVRAALEGCSDAAVIMFCPYPGSADFANLLERGELTMVESTYYVGLLRSSSSNRSWNRRMSSRQLRLLQLAMLSCFYAVAMLRRPRRIVAFLHSLVGDHEETYLDQVVRTLRRNLTPSNAADRRDDAAA
ncbi:MAG: B12-binding domain-containing radical SAM protein [Microthrixaceae bacterium]